MCTRYSNCNILLLTNKALSHNLDRIFVYEILANTIAAEGVGNFRGRSWGLV